MNEKLKSFWDMGVFYIQSPIKAGYQGRFPPLSSLNIFYLIAILAILQTFILFISVPFMISDFQEAGLDERIIAWIYELRNSPIRIYFVYFAFLFLSNALFWVVGRNFCQGIGFHEVMTSILKFSLVQALVVGALQVISLLLEPIGLYPVLSIISTGAAIAFFVLFILVLQGIFECKTVGKAILLMFLYILAFIGLFVLFGFIVGVFLVL